MRIRLGNYLMASAVQPCVKVIIENLEAVRTESKQALVSAARQSGAGKTSTAAPQNG